MNLSKKILFPVLFLSFAFVSLRGFTENDIWKLKADIKAINKRITDINNEIPETDSARLIDLLNAEKDNLVKNKQDLEYRLSLIPSEISKKKMLKKNKYLKTIKKERLL